MDSIRVSEAPDTGSIPVEATPPAGANAKAGFFYVKIALYSVRSSLDAVFLQSFWQLFEHYF